MGMATLTVTSTDFVIYAFSDASFVVLIIYFDEEYIRNVLSTVQPFYWHMLHFLCLKNKNTGDVTVCINNEISL